MTQDHRAPATTPPGSRAGSIGCEDRLWWPNQSRLWSHQHRGENYAPKVGEARRIRTPCLSPILALMIAGLLALARPAAAETWIANCGPLLVGYNFNTGSAVISLLTETTEYPVALGRIMERGRNYAEATFPGPNINISMIINIRTEELLLIDFPTGEEQLLCLPSISFH